METISIKVLDPKIKKTIHEWEKQKLIEIDNQEIEEKLWEAVDEIRENGNKHPISLAEITVAVEKVRAKRYEVKKNR